MEAHDAGRREAICQAPQLSETLLLVPPAVGRPRAPRNSARLCSAPSESEQDQDCMSTFSVCRCGPPSADPLSHSRTGFLEPSGHLKTDVALDGFHSLASLATDEAS